MLQSIYIENYDNCCCDIGASGTLVSRLEFLDVPTACYEKRFTLLIIFSERVRALSAVHNGKIIRKEG